MNSNYYMQTPDGDVMRVIDPDLFQGWKRLTKAEGEKLYREQHKASLLKQIKPGQTIYTKLCHVSRSGMQREISLYIAATDDKGEAIIQRIDYSASIVMGDRIGKHDGIVVGGCGMDMGFHLVYTLGRYLWPNGTPEPHGTRNGAPDRDGGYALKHQWI